MAGGDVAVFDPRARTHPLHRAGLGLVGIDHVLGLVDHADGLGGAFLGKRMRKPLQYS
jgi:hypothetical protein